MAARASVSSPEARSKHLLVDHWRRHRKKSAQVESCVSAETPRAFLLIRQDEGQHAASPRIHPPANSPVPAGVTALVRW